MSVKNYVILLLKNSLLKGKNHYLFLERFLFLFFELNHYDITLMHKHVFHLLSDALWEIQLW